MWSTSSAARPAAARSAITWSETVRPRFTAPGWAKTGTPPAARTSRTAVTGSVSCLRTSARPPLASQSAVNASDTEATTPASTSALAMCGRPTEPSPAIRRTCSQLMSAPSSRQRSTIARPRRNRSVRTSSRSAAKAGSAGSKR